MRLNKYGGILKLLSFVAIVIAIAIGVGISYFQDIPKDKDYTWTLADVKDVMYIPGHSESAIGISGTFMKHIPESWRLKIFIPKISSLAYISTYEEYKSKDNIMVGYAYGKHSKDLKLKYKPKVK